MIAPIATGLHQVVRPYVTWTAPGGFAENADGAAADVFRLQVDCWADADDTIEVLASAVRAAIEPAAHLVAYIADERNFRDAPIPHRHGSTSSWPADGRKVSQPARRERAFLREEPHQGTVIKTQGTDLYWASGLTAVKRVVCATGITGLGGARDQVDTSPPGHADRTFIGGLGTRGQVTVSSTSKAAKSHMRTCWH